MKKLLFGWTIAFLLETIMFPVSALAAGLPAYGAGKYIATEDTVSDDLTTDDLLSEESSVSDNTEEADNNNLTVMDFQPTVKDDRDFSGTITDGVWIGPLDMSDMTEEDARRSIAVYVASLGDSEITIDSGNGQSSRIKASDLGLTWNDNDTLYEAFSLCRKGDVVSRFKEMEELKNNPQTLPLNLSFDKKLVEEAIKSRAQEYNVEPTDSTMEKSEDGFIITEGNTGYIVDEVSSVNEILGILDDWDGKDVTVTLKADIKKPRGTKEELSQIKDLLGSFSTSYASSSSDRTGNLKNGVSHINGTILYPGDEFSTYEMVSPFTAENGYFLAGSYRSGSVVETFGGGICQVSTTLYNAVLLSELEIVERHNHSMPVHYIELSGDAAISGTEKDFKFKNNSDYPIFIEGVSDVDRKITFNIYGVETRPENRTLEFESVLLGEKKPEETVVEDPTKPIGYRSVKGGQMGYSGEYWKIVKVDGVEVEREKINTSHYQPTPITIVIGTAEVDPALAALMESAAAAVTTE